MKFYIRLGVLVVLLVVLAVLIVRYRQGREAVVLSENRGAVLENTSAGVREGGVIDNEQAERDAGLAAGRERFQQAKREAIRNEPQTADRADRPVPDSVRDAFRERRRARERLGCAGRECGEDDATDPAAER